MSDSNDPLVDVYQEALRARARLGVKGTPGVMFEKINRDLDIKHPLNPTSVSEEPEPEPDLVVEKMATILAVLAVLAALAFYAT